MSDEVLAERWSVWYVVRGVVWPVVIGEIAWFVMRTLGRLLIHLPVAWIDRLSMGALSIALMVGDWMYALAPVVGGAIMVFGIGATLAGGLARSYRLETSALSVKKSTFSRTKKVDLDRIAEVDVRSGWIARRFHAGSVEVRTDARTLTLKSVSHPERWAQALEHGGKE